MVETGSIRKKWKYLYLHMIEQALDIHLSISEIDCIQSEFEWLLKIQQDMICVGEGLERRCPSDESLAIVHKLEEYCENLFPLFEMIVGNIAWEQDLFVANNNRCIELLRQVKLYISNLKEIIQIVFMPYKVEMWDSLESIYLAAKEDPDCEALVVPIPYLHYDSAKGKAVIDCDGSLFPKDIDVISWEEYHLEEELPEICYIHNPYDMANQLTSVHPAYYSEKLKRNVDLLVYVPYYIGKGLMSKAQQDLPAYRNVDYIVVQSERTKNSCINKPYFDKMIPLGTPKLDRLFSECHRMKQIPEEWSELLGNKKIFFLNTSISAILHYGSAVLERLKLLFDETSKRADVAIIWRPHPLLRTTLASQRHDLVEKYDCLQSYYLEKRIGVLDLGQDFDRVIACSDAYVGEADSSVAILFELVGKPLFILNYMLSECGNAESHRRVSIRDFKECDEDFVISVGDTSLLLVLQNDRTTVRTIKQKEEKPTFWWSCLWEEYGLKRELKAGESSYRIWSTNSSVSRLLAPGVWEDFIISENDLVGTSGKRKPDGYDYIEDIAAKNETCYVVCGYSNVVIGKNQYSNEPCTYQLDNYSIDTCGFCAVAYDESKDGLWLCSADGSRLYFLYFDSLELECYVLPNDFLIIEGPGRSKKAYGKLLVTREKIYLVPYYSREMLCFHKETGTAEVFFPEVWECAKQSNWMYMVDYSETVSAAILVDDNTILLQRKVDDALILFDLKKERYDISIPQMVEKDYQDIKKKSDGFEMIHPKLSIFARKESRYFTLEEFLDDLVENRLDRAMERQKEQLSGLAEHADGTAGLSIHHYMKRVVTARSSGSPLKEHQTLFA